MAFQNVLVLLLLLACCSVTSASWRVIPQDLLQEPNESESDYEYESFPEVLVGPGLLQPVTAHPEYEFITEDPESEAAGKNNPFFSFHDISTAV